MCGRFSLHIPMTELIEYLRLAGGISFDRRYNIAPSETIPVIRREGGERRLGLARWGLVPHWAKDAKIGYRMINARAETVASKPSFRGPFHRQRCIVPASGFYEWRQTDRTRCPYHIFRADGNPLALAGLWDRWENPDDPAEVVISCTIITTEASQPVAKLHDRMPAILEPEEFDSWLDPDRSRRDLLALLHPAAEVVLDFHPVSDYVNKPGHEGEECIEPAAH
jgi:putative SOS response-associated peptidase YedK